MKDGRERKVYVVAAHAHHLLLVGDGVGGKGNQDRFAAEKEWTDELALRRHHLHPPGVARELRHSYQIVIVDELDGFQREVANHLRLLARLDVMILDVLERFLP